VPGLTGTDPEGGAVVFAQLGFGGRIHGHGGVPLLLRRLAPPLPFPPSWLPRPF
jgi:hypothetical protein